MAQHFRSLLTQGLDPDRDLMLRGIQDEKLFKEVLLAKITPDGKIPEQATRRLNAWLATVFGGKEENG